MIIISELTKVTLKIVVLGWRDNIWKGGGVSAVPQKKYTIFQNYQFFDISPNCENWVLPQALCTSRGWCTWYPPAGRANSWSFPAQKNQLIWWNNKGIPNPIDCSSKTCNPEGEYPAIVRVAQSCINKLPKRHDWSKVNGSGSFFVWLSKFK